METGQKVVLVGVVALAVLLGTIVYAMGMDEGARREHEKVCSNRQIQCVIPTPPADITFYGFERYVPR